MKWLLANDPQIRDIVANPAKVPIWFNMIEFSFGLFRRSAEEMLFFEQQITEFRASKVESLFVLFIGCTNHWLTFIIYKKSWSDKPSYTQDKYVSGRKRLNKFYLLDCSNL